MAKEGKKYLVETSAVPAATNTSTGAHCRHFAEAVQDGHKWSSTYIRKEFVNRFFCELAYAAFVISHRTSVKDALVLLSQRYSIRNIKVDLIAIGHLLDQQKAMNDPQVAAEEIGRFAINWLKTFDRIFRHRIPNASGCRIGHKRPNIDYNMMLKDLNSFYQDFKEPVDDCPVNEFVGVGNPKGTGQALVSEETTKTIDSVKNLGVLLAKRGRFVCDDCRKIGDAVIALEQPEDQCLIHIDKAYNRFCRFLKREHKQIKSAVAIDKETMTTQDRPQGLSPTRPPLE